MPTVAEWIFIAFVFAVIFGFHRLRTMGDALGAVLGLSKAAPDDGTGGEPPQSAPPADAS